MRLRDRFAVGLQPRENTCGAASRGVGPYLAASPIIQGKPRLGNRSVGQNLDGQVSSTKCNEKPAVVRARSLNFSAQNYADSWE
jgi:hypothetical protein